MNRAKVDVAPETHDFTGRGPTKATIALREEFLARTGGQRARLFDVRISGAFGGFDLQALATVLDVASDDEVEKIVQRPAAVETRRGDAQTQSQVDVARADAGASKLIVVDCAMNELKRIFSSLT
jgi:hypothetical protein